MEYVSKYTLIYVTTLYSLKRLSFFEGKALNAVCNRICVGLMYIKNFRQRL